MIVVVVAFQTLKKNNQYQKKKNIGLVQRPCNPCLFLDVYKRGPREYQTTSFHVHDFSLHHHTTAAVGKGFVVWKERRGSGKDQYTCDGCEAQSPPWNTAKATNMEHNKATVEKEQCTCDNASTVRRPHLPICSRPTAPHRACECVSLSCCCTTRRRGRRKRSVSWAGSVPVLCIP